MAIHSVVTSTGALLLMVTIHGRQSRGSRLISACATTSTATSQTTICAARISLPSLALLSPVSCIALPETLHRRRVLHGIHGHEARLSFARAAEFSTTPTYSTIR